MEPEGRKQPGHKQAVFQTQKGAGSSRGEEKPLQEDTLHLLYNQGVWEGKGLLSLQIFKIPQGI